MQSPEATQIERRERQQEPARRPWETPGRERRIERWTHEGYTQPPASAAFAGRAELRAGGSFAGCMVIKNAVMASTSGGLSALPYPGILPPPCKICRINSL